MINHAFKSGFLILVFTAPLLAVTGIELAEKMDQRDLPNDMRSRMKMVLTNKKGKTRNKEVISISADDNEKQIMWFQEPKDDRGVAFLKIEHDDKDDEMRLWLPAFNKTRRISSDNKSDSFMGSDISYEDLSTRELDEYTYKILGEETVSGTACYILESTPKPEIKSEYSRHVDWVSKSAYTVLKVEGYDKKGRLLKSRNTEFQTIGGYELPKIMQVKNVQKNHTTELTFSDITVDQGLPEDQFQDKRLKRMPK